MKDRGEKVLIVYLITCLLNRKIYVGQHGGIKDDNYLGSGKLINYAINKYGKENFIRETLRICHSQRELDNWEIIYIVKFDSRNKKKGYNIAVGGGAPMRGRHHSEKTKRKLSEIFSGSGNPWFGVKGINNPNFGRLHTEEWKKENSIRMSGSNHPLFGRHLSEWHKKILVESNLGNKWTLEQKNARSKMLKEIFWTKNRKEEHSKKMSGKNNSNFNMVYITNGKENRFINKNESLPIGFWFGLTRKTIPRKFITNGKETRTIIIGEELPGGFWYGMTRKFNNIKCVTDGITNKKIAIDSKIPRGFYLGRTFKKHTKNYYINKFRKAA